jgi:hypothetical protein
MEGEAGKAAFDYATAQRWEDPLTCLVRQALEPVIHLDTSWTLEVAEKKVATYLWKGGKSFDKENDWRLKEKNGTMAAQSLIYDFCNATFGAISAGCYDKQWYWEANWAPVMNYWVNQKLGESKCLSAVMKPLVERYVEESFTRFRDDERIQAAFEKVVETAGLPANHHKKATQFLNKSFEEAFRASPYGRSQHPDPAVKMLEDFYFGWMRDFMHRGSSLLSNGIGEDPQAQATFCVALFQSMAGPTYRVMPFDIGQLFALDESKLPGEEWDFIIQATQDIFTEEPEPQPQAAKGAGKGKKMRLW